ncbi:MAG: SUMF1/EgtB/PvdO family nonheme iron enzyme [Nitrospinales bacterium]
MAQESKQKPSGKKLRTSQLTFALPKELHNEFKARLEEVRDREKAAAEKMRQLLEKEKTVDAVRLKLEEQETAFRMQMQKQMAALQQRSEQEKKLSRAEIGRLKKELEDNRQQCEILRANRDKTLEEWQKQKTRLENKLLSEEAAYKEKFDVLTEQLHALTEDKAEFLERKKRDRRRAAQKEAHAKKAAAEQAKKIREIKAALKEAEQTKKQYKAQLDQEFQAKVEELKKEFDERSEYHNRRLDEAREEEIQLERKWEALKTREQSLILEAQRKSDEQTKVKQAELDKRDKALVQLQKQLTEQEEILNEQRKQLIRTLKVPKGAKFIAAQLNNLALEEEKVLNSKKEFLQSLKKLHAPDDEIIRRKIQVYEKEKNKALAKLREEQEELKKERERLRKKEQAFIRRETAELKRLNEDYEEFKDSLEIEQMEQNTQLDEMRDKLHQEEQKLLERMKQQQQDELEAAQRIKEREDLAVKELEAVQKVEKALLLKQQEMDNFLNNFQTTYKRRLDLQASEFETFKKKLDDLKAEAETMNRSLKEKEERIREQSRAIEEAASTKLRDREALIDAMEQELRGKLKEYQAHVTALRSAKKEIILRDQARQAEYLESLSHYESRLFKLGKAFEDLSAAFQAEKDSGRVEVIADEGGVQGNYKTRITKDGDLAKLEWPFAVRCKIDPDSMNIDDSMLKEYLDATAERWDEWIDVPPGEYWMGLPDSRESSPHRRIKIDKPVAIAKYPLTSAQFYQFIHATGYKTEAEQTVNGIVYHDGRHLYANAEGRLINQSYANPSLNPEEAAAWFRPNGQPESLFEKHNHPVTQVTWNDAMAYCRWKSEQMGATVRLPWESEWEYVAKNFGTLPPEEFYWSQDEIKDYCNIEETGIGDTTPVNYFPEPEMGVRDLFGNVYEWMMDARAQHPSRSAKNGLEYKMARGGSYITHYRHIAPWRRLPFVINYCTSFLGFRVVVEGG